MQDDWQETIRNAPHAPGVYIMKDSSARTLYVGKAKDLNYRTRAYLNRADSRFMIPFLTSRIATVAFIVTQTEKEALLLENTLIKAEHPKYNVNLRDDKNYYSIRIDTQGQKYPRFQLVRQTKKDGARYFGPYPSSTAARETLHFLQPLFPLRTCKDREFKKRCRPCLEYQIKRCMAPCIDLIDETAYMQLVRDSIAFLEGRGKMLLNNLTRRMQQSAQEENFEGAAVLRDRIAALKVTTEKQQTATTQLKDRDVFGVHREGDRTQIILLHIRKGKLLGTKPFPVITLSTSTEELISSLIAQYYDEDVFLPMEIILPCLLDDGPVITEWLTGKKGGKVSLITPRKGRAKELLNMAVNNAEQIFAQERRCREDPAVALDQLSEYLGMNKSLHHIECFDISHTSGQYAVGSLVTFLNGSPWKEGYRRFRIRIPSGADDYAMMREVLQRRYEDRKSLPDLVIVDGGRGQLGVALALFKDFGIEDVEIIGLAKERSGETSSTVNKFEDRIYLPHRKNPLYLSHIPAALHVLQHIRNEAHRFALTYHRRVKEKADLRSRLDSITGIGNKRKKALLTHFQDLKTISSATDEELQAVDGIGPELAQAIINTLNKGILE